MRLATPEAFAADPGEVHAFYNLRRAGVLAAEPNPAHHALAQLEAALRERGGRLFLCTQNVDDLHERAGSTEPAHMHGEILKARCLACEAVHPRRTDLSTHTPCPACRRGGGLRPDIVWFGEMPKHWEAIDSALREAELFVAIGTSGAVYPAAGFVARARHAGIRTCELNLAPSDNAGMFDDVRTGPASTVVPDFVRAILA